MRNVDRVYVITDERDNDWQVIVTSPWDGKPEEAHGLAEQSVTFEPPDDYQVDPDLDGPTFSLSDLRVVIEGGRKP